MSGPNKNYLKAAEAAKARSWRLPEFGQPVKRISSVEKERKDQHKTQVQRAAESVEEIAVGKMPTATELAAIIETARAEGHSEGFKQGQIEGLREGREEGLALAVAEKQQEIDAQLAKFQQLCDQLAPHTEHEKSQLLDTLFDLTTRLTRCVVKAELNLPSAHIVNLVKAALNTLPVTQTPQPTQIHVNPQDLEQLQPLLQQAVLGKCELIADAAISVGGCTFKRGASRIDARVEHQLQEVFSSFLAGNLISKEVQPAVSEALASDDLKSEQNAAPVTAQLTAATETESISHSELEPVQPSAATTNQTPNPDSTAEPKVGGDHVE